MMGVRALGQLPGQARLLSIPIVSPQQETVTKLIGKRVSFFDLEVLSVARPKTVVRALVLTSSELLSLGRIKLALRTISLVSNELVSLTIGKLFLRILAFVNASLMSLSQNRARTIVSAFPSPSVISLPRSMNSTIVFSPSHSLLVIRRYTFHAISLVSSQTAQILKTTYPNILVRISQTIYEFAANYNIRATYVTNNVLTFKGNISRTFTRVLTTPSHITAIAVRGITALPLTLTVFSSQVISKSTYFSKNLIITYQETLVVIKSFALPRTLFSILNPNVFSYRRFVGKGSVFSLAQSLSLPRYVNKIVGIVSSEVTRITRAGPAYVKVLSSQYVFLANIRQVAVTFSVPVSATSGKITNKIIILYQFITQPKRYELVFSYLSPERVTIGTATLRFVGQIATVTSSAFLAIPILVKGRLFPIVTHQITSIKTIGGFFRTFTLTIPESLSVKRISSRFIDIFNPESFAHTKAINRLNSIASPVSLLLSKARVRVVPQFLITLPETWLVNKAYYRTFLITTINQISLVRRVASGGVLIVVGQTIALGKTIYRLVINFTSEVLATTTSIQYTAFAQVFAVGQALSLVAKQPIAQFRFLIHNSQLMSGVRRAGKIAQVTSASVFTSAAITSKSIFLSLSVGALAIVSPSKFFQLIANQKLSLIKLFYELFNIQTIGNLTLVKGGVKTFSYLSNEAITLFKPVNKYAAILSSYALSLTKVTNKAFSFTTRPATLFSRIGSKHVSLIQNLTTKISKPTSKVLSFASIETVITRLGTSRIVSFVSSQLNSISRVSSKIVKVPIHSLLQFVRVSKGRIFIGIDQTLSTVKSTSWHLLTRSPERLTLPRVTTKRLGIQEHVTARMSLTAGKASSIISAVRTSLARTTNKITRVSLIESTSLIRRTHKTIVILSREKVKQLFGKAVVFTQHTSLSLRRRTLKIIPVVSNGYMVCVTHVKKARSIVLRSAQSLVDTKTVRKIVRLAQGQTARISRRISIRKLIHSLQLITVNLGHFRTVVVLWLERLVVRRASTKSLLAKVSSRVTVPRTTFKHIGFVIYNKVQQGRMHYLALSYMTPMVATVHVLYNKVFSVVQGSVITVIKKVRTLIQRAIILLTGA